MQRLGQYLGYFLLRSVIAAVQALPLWLCASGARGLAALFCLLGVRRRVIDDNLRHAFPASTRAERDRLKRRMWEHLLLFAAEVAHTSRKIHETTWHRHVHLTEGSEEAMARALMDDRPLVLATAHYGNFELAAYFVALFGYPVYSVARPLDNPFLDRFVNRFRGSTGQTILTKQGDYERILDLLAAGETVSFVADQYAGRKGCWVEFFGRPASAHKAIALFALDNDAPLGVGYCRRTDGPLRYDLCLHAVADPRSNGVEVSGMRPLTQWYTSRFEEVVREAPEQYWWLHRRWKDHRKKKRAAAKAA